MHLRRWGAGFTSKKYRIDNIVCIINTACIYFIIYSLWLYGESTNSSASRSSVGTLYSTNLVGSPTYPARPNCAMAIKRKIH